MSFAARPMMGGTGVVNPLPGGDVWHSVAAAGTATATITVRRDGLLTGTSGGGGGGGTFSHNWHIVPHSTIGDAFWVRILLAFGNTPTSGVALNTWHQLNANRSITYTLSIIGALNGTFTIQIASDSAGTNIVGASAAGGYTMSAEVVN